MIKVKVTNDNFLKVKETLTRMGIANSKEKVLYQSCHILFKRDEYYIVHFKELLAMDGLNVQMTQEDIQRRDSIAQMLQCWGLVEIVDGQELTETTNNFRIISHKDSKTWKLLYKYHIGN